MGAAVASIASAVLNSEAQSGNKIGTGNGQVSQPTNFQNKQPQSQPSDNQQPQSQQSQSQQPSQSKEPAKGASDSGNDSGDNSGKWQALANLAGSLMKSGGQSQAVSSNPISQPTSNFR